MCFRRLDEQELRRERRTLTALSVQKEFLVQQLADESLRKTAAMLGLLVDRPN